LTVRTMCEEVQRLHAPDLSADQVALSRRPSAAGSAILI
jgi:hypothetical protein